MSFWHEYSHAEIMSMHGVEISDPDHMNYEVDIDFDIDDDEEETDDEEEDQEHATD